MLNAIIKRLHLPFQLDHRRDRIAMYAALGIPVGLIMALTKLVMGLLFTSSWLLIFGTYYVVLLAVKSTTLWRYRRIRVKDAPIKAKIHAEQAFLTLGGIGYCLIGITFGSFCYVMYAHGYDQRFNLNAALIVAMIGFTKLTSATVGLVRSRHLLSPLITLLKAYSVADGMTAIVLTQYALLTYQHSPQANAATGLFGMAISVVVVIVGLWITIVATHRDLSGQEREQ
ncbi:hypothetical protein [Lacticaseibacillus kribbianus]|uniref:hypothetical protein n=1 Tax=Lacticaseibacillus kribbianus TaxID=2926292 RepID=UPI001CD2A3FD|nr:hypothetical protein [Lacticaseibacillus kribbianus]